MSETYLCTWVGDRVGEYNGKYGLLKQYRIALNNSRGEECRGTKQDGSESKTFQLSQKEGTPAPLNGDTLYGHIEDGWKFVKDQQPEGSAPSAQTSSSSATQGAGGTATGSTDSPDPDANQGGGQPPSAPARPSVYGSPVLDKQGYAGSNYTELAAKGQPIDERQRSIVRQHSQEMAIRALAVGERLAVPNLGSAATGPKTYWLLIRKWTNLFEQDAFGRSEPDPSDADSGTVTELPRADEKTALNLREAQDLAIAAQRKMSAQLLDSAIRNTLGTDKSFSNPIDAFMLFTPGMAFEFTMTYLKDEEHAA